jgi:hypothetical protein
MSDMGKSHIVIMWTVGPVMWRRVIVCSTATASG